MIKHFHAFAVETKYYVIDTVYVVICEINSEQYEYLSKYENDLLNDENLDEKNVSIKEMFDAVFKKGLFASENLHLPSEEISKTGFIALTPVHLCNFRCKYCFAEHGENYSENEKTIDLKTIKNALDFAISDYFSNAENIRIEMVGGGENFLKIEKVKEILDTAETLCKNAKKNFDAFILSNGSLMNEEILRTVDRNYVSLGISLDGRREINDYQRPDASGKGTYDLISKNIEYVLQNAKSRSVKNLWGLVVITAKTGNLMDVLAEYKQRGINSVQMRLVRVPNDSEFSVSGENIFKIKKMYKDLIDSFKKDIDQCDISNIKMILNDSDYLGKILVRLFKQKIVNTRCLAGKNKISITANGDIYPCDAFVGIDRYKIGNINGSKQLFENDFVCMSVDKRDECKKCWAKYLCGGDCLHNSYIHNGNISQPDSEFCEIQKFLIESCVDLVNYISPNEEIASEIVSYVTKRADVNRFMH